MIEYKVGKMFSSWMSLVMKAGGANMLIWLSTSMQKKSVYGCKRFISVTANLAI